MFPSNKTTVDLNVNWATLEKHAWEKFVPKLAAVQTMADVRALLADAPPPGTPSSRFYANLADFLLTSHPPQESDSAERDQYVGLVERLEASGSLDAGVATASLAILRGAREKSDA